MGARQAGAAWVTERSAAPAFPTPFFFRTPKKIPIGNSIFIKKRGVGVPLSL